MTVAPSVLLAMSAGLDTVVLDEHARRSLRAVAASLSGPSTDLDAADDELLAAIDVVIGGWGCPRFTGELVARMPRLQMIVHAAGTVRGIVTPAVWRRGIVVSSAAAANAAPVAEFAFAAIVFVGKDVFRLRDGHRARRGRPASEPDLVRDRSIGNRDRRIGIVGAGHIGRRLIERLHTLDATIGVADPYLTHEDAVALGVTRFDLDDLCAWADVVSLHAPARPATRHMIGVVQLAAMHDGAWVLNTARGQLVDTTALTDECVAGRLNAFIDTIDPSPLPPESPLWDLPNVVLTPHLAGSLGNEVARLGTLAVAEITRWTTGQPLHHQVHEHDLARLA